MKRKGLTAHSIILTTTVVLDEVNLHVYVSNWRLHRISSSTTAV